MAKKNKAKDAYVQNLAGNSATNPTPIATPGVDQNKLQGIKDEALKVKGMVDQFAANQNTGSTSSSGASTGLKEMSSALSPRPATPDFYGGAKTAMDKYIESLMPTTEENDLASRLSKMRSSISSGVQQAGEQAIPMGFITGQQQAIENRGLNALQPFEDELSRLSGNREALSDGLDARQKFEMGLADNKAEDYRYQDETAIDERRYAYDVANKESTPIEIDGKLLRKNADGGYDEIYTPPPATPEPFELSEGQSRYEYDPATGEYKLIASKGKTYKPDSNEADKATEERVSQVLDGFITLEDLSVSERTKVQDQLFELGFGSDKPPAWFADYARSEGLAQTGLGNKPNSMASSPALNLLRGNPTPQKTVQQAWADYRKTISSQIEKTRGGSSDPLGFDS